MTDNHPITPPPKLVHQWHKIACKDPYNGGTFFDSKVLKSIATQAARWGWQQRDASVANELQEARDEELEECRKAIADQIITVDNIGLGGPAGVAHTKAFSSWPAFAQMVSRQLRNARRPKPPSLKEQALEVLKRLPIDPEAGYCPSELDTIRRALEALPD